MKPWQSRAILKAKSIDFVKDENKIKKVFKELCTPLLDVEGISFDDENSTLNIKDKYYKLEVTTGFIRIRFLTDINEESVVVYGIKQDTKEFAYGKGHNINPLSLEFEKLYSSDFNYEEIIDNLMTAIMN